MTAHPHAPASDAALHAGARARLAQVMPQSPASLEEARAAVARHRGRGLEVIVGEPVDGHLPAGLWLQLRDRDVVWVDRRTSPMHRIVIVGHELGHMIWGHAPVALRAEAADVRPILDLAGHELPGLSPAHIGAIIGHCRTSATRDRADWLREREAEIVGRLLARQLLGADPDVYAAALAEL